MTAMSGGIMVHMVSIFKVKGKNRLWLVFMGTGLILKPWSDVHSKSRFNSKTYEAFQTFSTKKCTKTCLVTFGTYKVTKYNNVINSTK